MGNSEGDINPSIAKELAPCTADHTIISPPWRKFLLRTLGTILFNLVEHPQGHAANVLGFTLERILVIRRPFKT